MICDVIILAAGSGTRFGEKKQFYPVGGTPILVQTLRNIYQSACFRNCVVVVPTEDVPAMTNLLIPEYPRLVVIAGGETRFLSSRLAVEHVLSAVVPPEVVIVHDGVRPFVDPAAFAGLCTAMEQGTHDGFVYYLPIHDSIIHFTANMEAQHTYLDRAQVVRVQTPHIYNATALQTALASEDRTSMRENAEIFFSAGYRLGFLEGDPFNIKVTTRTDLRYFS